MVNRVLSMLLMLGAGILQAQDQLFKTDNTKLLVKITEINPTEVRYKLFSNQEGPTYIENRKNVSLIIYENGKHEVINAAPLPGEGQLIIERTVKASPEGLSKADSMAFYMYRNSLSINFLNFFNNEMGFMFQRDFYDSDFNIQIPFAFGVERPGITQEVYFGNRTYANGNANARLNLIRKNFEIGFGINYYPNLKSRVNYYIGPVFRYMQYQAEHQVTYWTGQSPYNYNYFATVNQPAILSRYCMSITNGFIFRTRSRLTASVYASLGFKNDDTDRPAENPFTGVKFDTYKSSTSLYFWSGFNAGFSF